MEKPLTKILVIAGIGFMVCALWQGLELLYDGKIVASEVDIIIGVILTYSLYGNYLVYTGEF